MCQCGQVVPGGIRAGRPSSGFGVHPPKVGRLHWLKTAVIFRQLSILHNLIGPVATRCDRSTVLDASYSDRYGPDVTAARKNSSLGTANARRATAVTMTRRQRRRHARRATLARHSELERSAARQSLVRQRPPDPDRLLARLIYRDHDALARKISARRIEVVSYL
jgi:hypothetical protein